MSLFNHIGPKKKRHAKPAPKPRGHTVFSAPLPKGKAFSPQQHKAKVRVRRAEKALPKQRQRSSSLPPRENSITRAGRGNLKNSLGQIDRAEKKAESKRVHSIPGKDNQKLERANISIEKILATLKDVEDTKHDLLHPKEDDGLRGFLSRITGSGPRTHDAPEGGTGFPIAAADSKAAMGGVSTFNTSIPSRAAKNLAVAFADDPGKTGKNTAKGLRDSALGALPAVAGLVSDTVEGTLHGDPLRGAKKEGAAYLKDLERRYGDLAAGTKQGEAKFRKRVQSEGAAGELFDAATLSAGAGAAIGRGVGTLGKAGKLGKNVEKIANAEKHPRPRLIESEGGKGKEQELHPNIFKALAQRGQDSARKRVDVAGGKGHLLKAARGKEGKRSKALPRDLAADEVRPLFRTLGDRQVKKNVAREQARGRVGMGDEQLHEVVKGFGREVSRLNKNQKRAFYYAGVGVSSIDPATALKDLQAHKARILENRAKEKTKLAEIGETPKPRKTDEIPGIEKLIEVAKKEADLAPEQRKVFNDKLKVALDASREREARVAARDVDLHDDQALMARHAFAGESLGVRRDTPRSDAIAEKELQASEAAASIPGLEREVSKAKQDQQVFQARLTERAATRRRTDSLVGERADRSAASRPFTRHEKELQNELHALETLHSTEARHPAATARIAEIKKELSPQVRRAGSDVTPHEIDRYHEHSQKVEEAAAQLDAARVTAKDKSVPEHLRDESADEYASRVREEVARAGREQPFYFPSQAKARVFASDHAVGGARAVQGHKHRSGYLHRHGRQDIDVAVLAQGLARSIKRRWNWNVVARTYADNRIHIAPEKIAEALGRDAERLDPDSLTIQNWEDVMDHMGIDPHRVAFWNPRKFYAEERRHSEEDLVETNTTSRGEETSSGLRATLAEASVSGDGIKLKSRPEAFDDSGWQMISKAAHGEIEAITKPSGPLVRGFEIAKGKAARVLLGLGNVPWLTFQVASNAVLTGFAVGPKALLVAPLITEIAGAQKWWKGLDGEQRRAVSAYIGVGPFQEDIRVTRQGGDQAVSNLVNGWRAFKGADFFHTGLKIPVLTEKTGRRSPTIAQLNPLDALFRTDNAQNNMFRRTVLYNKVKRDAYKRMGTNTAKAMRMQDEIVGLLRPGKDVRATTVELLNNPKLLEKYASSVNDILGDYVTYTARERASLGRAVMFYGFLRYSLRLMFYTMPVKHPIVLSTLGIMGQLQASEVKSLVGEEIAKQMTAAGTKTSPEKGREIVDEVGLPFGIGTMFYAHDGHLTSIDLTRANPALNQMVSIKGINQLAGILPPFLNNALDQIYSTDSYRDRRLLVQGETTPRKKAGDYGIIDRLRIYAESQLKTAAPYRLAETWKFEGRPQGEDSMLFSPRPTKYVDEDILKSINKNAQSVKKDRSLLHTLVPLLPKGAENDVTNLATITLRERQRRADAKKAKKNRGKGGSSGGSSSGMSGLGGGSSSSGGMSGLGGGGGSSGGLSGLGN